MKLTDDQRQQFERDGFLVFPNLIAPEEVALLKRELARVCDIEDERVVRERAGGARIVYGLHEESGPTASAAYRALVRSRRILEPVYREITEGFETIDVRAARKLLDALVVDLQ